MTLRIAGMPGTGFRFDRMTMDAETGTNGGGPNGNNAGEQNGNVQQGGQTQNQPNNEQNYFDPNANIWENAEDGSGGGNGNSADGQNGNQSGQPGQQQQPPNPRNQALENLNAHIDGVDFGLNLTPEQLQAENAHENVQNAISNGLKSVYRNVLLDVGRIVTQSNEKLSSQIMSQVQGRTSADKAVSFMQDKLPFTKDQNVSPVAEATLTAFLKKGKTVEQAVEGVKQFFAHVHKTSAKDLGIANAPKGMPGSSGFNGSANEDDGNGIDWTKLLSGE